MKQLFLVCCTCLLVLHSLGQYPKIVVRFTNKAGNLYSSSRPGDLLSPRALDRRVRQNIHFDSTDLPISGHYIDSIQRLSSVTIISRSKWLNQILIQCTDQSSINKIRSFPFVRSVTGIGFRKKSPEEEKPVERTSQLVSNQPVHRMQADAYDYGNAYAQVHIHEGEFLHNKGYNGNNIHIAVIDAGFNQYRSLFVFDSIRMNGQVLGEKDFLDFDNSVNENDAHGTYCLSTMAANWPGKMRGTAPKASFWLMRTENTAYEYPVEEHNWVVAAEFADSSGADIISSSLGYYDFDDPAFDHSYTDFYKNTTTISQGATIAARKGMIVMNSAGNAGNTSWKYLGFPADADSVCAVGAVNAACQIASFSSYGYPGKVKPNIVSLGAGTVIATLSNQLATGSGTSYANPNVAGLVACLWQAFPLVNNMKLLDAVYKSASRYITPDDRYGYGIPNFKTAWRILKREQNTALYGADWLWASPDPFTSTIDVRLIGQVDGNAKIELLNELSQVVDVLAVQTTVEEVYDLSFINLDNLPAATYTIKYTDSLTSRRIQISKQAFGSDWLRLFPGTVFEQDLTVSFIAAETGKVSFRLVDVSGHQIETIEMNVTTSQRYSLRFSNLNKQAAGIYFLQYLGPSGKRTIRLLKR